MFRIDQQEWRPRRNLVQDYQRLVKNVNAVNHGEFETAVNMLLQQAKRGDSQGVSRCSAFCLQRCRRGGKTFMLHNIASQLSQQLADTETHVIFISLNSDSRYRLGREDAYQAILGRIAWEFSGSYLEDSYDDFLQDFTNFLHVNRWVRKNKVILVVDELNAIPPDAPSYPELCCFLDELVGRKGSCLVYSTHVRDTTRHVRSQLVAGDFFAKVRRHNWLMIPRIVNENCLRGMRNNNWTNTNNIQPSFWCAVLRGRLAALLVQPQRHIAEYGMDFFPTVAAALEEKERVAALAATITGEIAGSRLLTNNNNNKQGNHHLFRAYSYMSERFVAPTNSALYAWPPFLISQVLGKGCGSSLLLRKTLQDPTIDEVKAFEALTQLAVLVRLLSGQHHELVPHHADISNGGAFQATEILFVSSRAATTMAGVMEQVNFKFSERPHVLQVVAVPCFASFSTYDFFVLHRANDVVGGWKIAAGYQCQQGTDDPAQDASPDVPLSVWIEGNCRKYRRSAAEPGAPVVPKTVVRRRGWVLLGESDQVGMLGVSVLEALPAAPSCPASSEGHECCCAEMVWGEKMKAAASSRAATSSKTGSDDLPPEEKPRAKKARNF